MGTLRLTCSLTLQGGEGRRCVVKIEPHENGPLFVEMHYYLSSGRCCSCTSHLVHLTPGPGRT